MQRNALVSGNHPYNIRSKLCKSTDVTIVLLRVMEYYEGILILTTNRIKTFDVAVQSRVHLALRYQDLTPDHRKQVFKIFYKQLNTDNCDDLTAIRKYIEDDFEEEFNGRQIRNVFASAMALAREHKRKVCVGDFRQAVKVTRDFQKYLMEESIKARQRQE